MTHYHSIGRTLIVVSLGIWATFACAQQPVVTQPFPSFDPYATTQPGGVITGPALPSGTPTFDPSALPIFPAGSPVRLVLFGEFLYLRASDAAMTNYAVPVDAAGAPMGSVAFVEQSWEPGFRAGFDWVWNDYSRWVAAYSEIDMKTTDMASVDPTSTLGLQQFVLHPSTAAAGEFYQTASARGDVKMRLGDIEYRRVYLEDWYRWDFLVGARYAGLDQRFRAEFTNATPRTAMVDADVKFDGGGIRFGTRGDWRSSQHGFFIYAQATTSFIAGQFSSRFTQMDSVGGLVANTSRKDDRIINLTDAELGVGWHSPSHRWWFSAGYLFNTWSDVVNTAGVIRNAQANVASAALGTSFFTPIRERLTFDGLVARAELRF